MVHNPDLPVAAPAHAAPASIQDAKGTAGDNSKIQTKSLLQTQEEPESVELSPVRRPHTGEKLLLRCGPLLRYTGTHYYSEGRSVNAKERGERQEGLASDSGASFKGVEEMRRKRPVWKGSVLVVCEAPEGKTEKNDPPRLYYTAGTAREETILNRDSSEGNATANTMSIKEELDQDGKIEPLEKQRLKRKVKKRHLAEVQPISILEEEGTSFWRFSIELELEENERMVEYFIHGLEGGPEDIMPHGSDGGEDQDEDVLSEKDKDSNNKEGVIRRQFWVPGENDTMRIMFHSCNGFSVNVDEEKWSGTALWNDVLRAHKSNPFHVTLGGGDQIYNDRVRVSGPLKEWTNMNNPRKRRRTPYTSDLKMKVERFYRENYIQWFSHPPFASANSRIPMINVWDDHDIIDGYGSYTDHFMRCPVFIGIGGAAFKYYMVFQHHTPPEGEQKEDPCWVIGQTPGPYIGQPSRSIYARLGRSVGFIGVDARTERTRKKVNYDETYNLIFERLAREVESVHPEQVDRSSGNRGNIRHVIVLLGIPIAYPRLVWLETIFRSPIFGFLSFLNKRFGVAGGLFNTFDGKVDLLDDLDDHYTASTHKKERNIFLHRLQEFSQRHSIRITILGGDVHLTTVGRFYAKRKLKINVEHDFRYMVNVISSAITNKPPPVAVAEVIAQRNRVHHLDKFTDESLLHLFDEDVDGKKRHNHLTMPRRNYAILTEVAVPEEDKEKKGRPYDDGLRNQEGERHHPSTSPQAPAVAPGKEAKPKNGKRSDWIGPGEEFAGSKHPAAGDVETEKEEGADGNNNSSPFEEVPTLNGSLNVTIRVEISQKDREGRTKGYGFRIPILNCVDKYEDEHGNEKYVPAIVTSRRKRWKDKFLQR